VPGVPRNIALNLRQPNDAERIKQSRRASRTVAVRALAVYRERGGCVSPIGWNYDERARYAADHIGILRCSQASEFPKQEFPRSIIVDNSVPSHGQLRIADVTSSVHTTLASKKGAVLQRLPLADTLDSASLLLAPLPSATGWLPTNPGHSARRTHRGPPSIRSREAGPSLLLPGYPRSRNHEACQHKIRLLA